MPYGNSARGASDENQIDFIWKGNHYLFYSDFRKETSTGKIVRRGTFREAPPCGEIKAGRTCALMELPFKQVSSRSVPPYLRMENELLTFFKAPHVRRVLAMDDASERLRAHLRRGQRPLDASFVCRIIEPWYDESVAALERSSLTAYERFELAIQIVEGLRELQRNLCADAPEQSVAHRDVKFENVLIQRNKNNFTAVLIDLVSVKTAAPENSAVYAMSPSNTAPELIDQRFRPPNGNAVTEKADVFALGGMIAELFGNLNPLRQWAENCAARGQTLPEQYFAIRQKYANNPMLSKEIWAEHELGGQFQWNRALLDATGAPDMQPFLRDLLRKTTGLYPKDRISLVELQTRLKRLQDACKKERDPSNAFLYLVPGQSTTTTTTAPSVPPVCLFCMSRPEYNDLYASPNVRAVLPKGRFVVGVYLWEEQSRGEHRIYLNDTPCESVNDLRDFLRDAWDTYRNGRRILVSSPADAFGPPSNKLSFQIFGPSPGGVSDDETYQHMIRALQRRAAAAEIRLFYCTEGGVVPQTVPAPPPSPDPSSTPDEEPLQRTPGNIYFYDEDGNKVTASSRETK